MSNLHTEIIHTISYFGFFEYAPKFDEIHTFLSKKVSKQGLQKELEELVKKNILSSFKGDYYIDSSLIAQNDRGAKYTLGEYSIRVPPSSRLRRASRSQYYISLMEKKIKYSSEKIQKAMLFIRILSWFPQIKLIGLSGSVAMMNAEEEDDTDLFIVTSAGRMWTARFISLILAHIMGVRRMRHDQNVQNKICLNLFFDESDLSLPKRKHTEYGAHEVLQMKPIVDKLGTYKRFLGANRWVYDLFPNAISIIKTTVHDDSYVIPTKVGIPLKVPLIGNLIEKSLKRIQLYLIKRHKTTETITQTQLWFFPDDFEKKMRKVL